MHNELKCGKKCNFIQKIMAAGFFKGKKSCLLGKLVVLNIFLVQKLILFYFYFFPFLKLNLYFKKMSKNLCLGGCKNTSNSVLSQNYKFFMFWLIVRRCNKGGSFLHGKILAISFSRHKNWFRN